MERLENAAGKGDSNLSSLTRTVVQIAAAPGHLNSDVALVDRCRFAVGVFPNSFVYPR
jgi:hypothetical protein